MHFLQLLLVRLVLSHFQDLPAQQIRPLCILLCKFNLRWFQSVRFRRRYHPRHKTNLRGTPNLFLRQDRNSCPCGSAPFPNPVVLQSQARRFPRKPKRPSNAEARFLEGRPVPYPHQGSHPPLSAFHKLPSRAQGHCPLICNCKMRLLHPSATVGHRHWAALFRHHLLRSCLSPRALLRCPGYRHANVLVLCRCLRLPPQDPFRPSPLSALRPRPHRERSSHLSVPMTRNSLMHCWNATRAPQARNTGFGTFHIGRGSGCNLTGRTRCLKRGVSFPHLGRLHLSRVL